jgi:hypothetical protein
VLVACRYEETRGNLALFAVDYQALFVDTIGRVVQQVTLSSMLLCSCKQDLSMLLLSALPVMRLVLQSLLHPCCLLQINYNV